MQIADITKKMIAYSEGNTHDINHFLKVWSFARTIGQLEGLDDRTQEILEAAALLHDIACPLCREKYGNTNGKYQEKEGMPLAEAFLKDCGLSLEDIQGMDYQILIEADYIVNAEESHYSIENIRHFREQIFRTESGKTILDSIYPG